MQIKNDKIISKQTNLELEIKNKINKDYLNINIYFSHQINELLDFLHFNFKFQIPIIIEGKKCQGISLSINYFLKLLRRRKNY